MKRICGRLIVGLMAGLTFMLIGATGASAAPLACDITTATECQITTAHAVTGPVEVDLTLHIFGTGRLDASGVGGITLRICVPPALPSPTCDLIIDTPTVVNGGQIEADDIIASAFPIDIAVSRDVLMGDQSKILSENVASGGSGNNITIVAGRDMTMGTSAKISASKITGSGDTGDAGNVTINVGDVVGHTSGVFTMAASTLAGSGILANGTGSAGAIAILAGKEMHIGGLVESFSGLSGTGGQPPGGGTITVVSGCKLIVEDTGIISSQGQDPGSDLVHLEGCDVLIQGLVQSHAPGKGHVPPTAPPNHCNLDTTAHPTVLGADLYESCIEIWGNTVTIDSTGTHKGKVNTAGTRSPGRTWIDIFARGDITIIADTGAYSVNADACNGVNAPTAPCSNSFAGLVNIKSQSGKVVMTALVPGTVGRAVSSAAVALGGRDGTINVEAGGASGSGFVDFTADSLIALDVAGSIVNGKISVQSFNDQVLGVLPGSLNSGVDGAVNLTACVGDPGTTYSGTVTGTETDAGPGVGCGGTPTFPTVPHWYTGRTVATFLAAAASCAQICGTTCTPSGIKFNDLTGNSVKDPLDPPVSGFGIHLFDKATLGVAVHLHTATDINGAWAFNVQPGEYIVCEDGGPAPNSPAQTFPASDGSGGLCATHVSVPNSRGYDIVLSVDFNACTSTDNNFGNFYGASVSGQKFNDLANNGVKDAGDPGWPGTNIHLFLQAGGGDQEQLTNASGNFVFTSVAPGDYYLCETGGPAPNAPQQTFPASDGSGGACATHVGVANSRGYAITVGANQTITGQDFGNFFGGTISGQKFSDLANDGVQDAGDPPVLGMQIILIDKGTAGGTVNLTTNTDASGNFSFGLILPGEYYLCEMAGPAPNIPAQTFPAIDETAGACSIRTGIVGSRGYDIVLAVNGTSSNKNFGNFYGGTISGQKFSDLANDGVQDAGDPPVAGMLIILIDKATAGVAVNLTTNTDASGNFSFGLIQPGEYYLCEQAGPAPNVPAQTFPASDQTGGACATRTGIANSRGYDIVLGVNGTSSNNNFGNFYGGTLTVNKVLVPALDTGRFNLQIDGSSPNAGSVNVGNGGTTGAVTVTAGSHGFGETGGNAPVTSLADYTTTWSCSDNTSGSGTGSTVNVPSGSAIVCTITNARKPRLTVNKVLVPGSDPGLFNLQIDGQTAGTGANVGNGGTTGVQVVTVGDHIVAETAGTNTSLADYLTVIGGECMGSGLVTLAAGDNKVCTITNTRRPPVLPPPKLTVNKILVPPNDPGLFNLQIDGNTAGTGANVGNGGTTGVVQVTAGSHTVGETAGTNTSLPDYTTVIGGDCLPDGSVSVTDGDDKVCTVTNTRKPTLTVIKTLVPSSDTGKFNLQIDGSTAGTGANVGNGGTTGAVVVTVGAHTVSEAAGTGTNLGDYTSVIGGACAANGTVTLAGGENKVCTITNTRKPSTTLTVVKVLVPGADPGKFNLQIDGATAGTGANVGNGGTTGAVVVQPGAHTASETAGTATSLGDYTSVIGGDCAANGSVTLLEGDHKTCTITNTRNVITTLTVIKTLVPSADPGKFNLQIDGATAGTGANVGNGGTTGAVVVVPGVHIAGEIAGTATNLNDYLSVIDGDCAANGSVTLAPGDNKICTITNTRRTPVFPPPPATDIPALDSKLLAALGILLAVAGAWGVRRRESVAKARRD